MKWISRNLRRATERLGYFTTPSTSEKKLAELLSRFFPFETDKPLLRIGHQNDGGYLVPDDLSGIEYCFSPGVSSTSTFEEDLLSRGIKSFLADYSVDGPPSSLREYVFDKKFLGSFDSETHITLANWVEKRLPGYDKDLILQMDIEGSEYPVLMETSEDTLKRFRVIVVEFHFLEQFVNASIFNVLREALEGLFANFTIVHIHPNNYRGVNRLGDLIIPNLLEMTFLRNDRVVQKRYASRFPHPLDRPNMPFKEDLVLPSCWYRAH